MSDFVAHKNMGVARPRKPLSVYIHWPFCVSKCPYCDFNSHVGDLSEQGKWRAAYRRELEHYAALLPQHEVTTIFFGGGTPSLMEPEIVAGVLEDLARLWPLAAGAELTLEANPSSAEAEKFAAFRAAGINRLSLGVQSFDPEALRFLGRAHDAAAARAAIGLAAKIFPRFSFDLIYARQGQDLAAWRAELAEALTLAGGHLSLYQLTIEPHTQFAVRARRGEALTAPDDASVAMYEATQEIMDRAGLPAYEISNHARPGEESRHNLAYWHYRDYIGIGPGAHGRCLFADGRKALENIRAPDMWLQHVAQHGRGLKLAETLDAATAMEEALMMGLRLAEGVNRHEWGEKFAVSLADFAHKKRVARLVEEGLLADEAEALRATRAGLQRLNGVLGYLLSSPAEATVGA